MKFTRFTSHRFRQDNFAVAPLDFKPRADDWSEARPPLGFRFDGILVFATYEDLDDPQFVRWVSVLGTRRSSSTTKLIMRIV